MTIDDLIIEGQTFKMTYKPPRNYITHDGLNIVEQEAYYFEDYVSLASWIEKSRRFIGVNFPDDQSYEDFCKCADLEQTDGSVARMIGILVSLRDIEGKCAIKQKEPSTSVTVNQSQTQTQTQNIEFVMSHLTEEFTQEQISQIEEIVKSAIPKGKKRSKLLDLFSSFGVSVGANLLTSMLIV